MLVFNKFRDKTLKKGFLKLTCSFILLCIYSTIYLVHVTEHPIEDIAAVIIEDDNSSFCVRTRTLPSFDICPFKPEEDVYVSAGLIEKGIWEPDILTIFQQALRIHPNATIIDIGSHVGFYSLLSAKMGHDVIAVEPYIRCLLRLRKAAKMNELDNKIKIVESGASNDRNFYYMYFKKGNIGGTYLRESESASSVRVKTVILSDLISIKERRTLIIKADAEGFECKSLYDPNLFEVWHIPYIFMEWGLMFRGRHISANPCQTEDLDILVFLLSLNYTAYVSKNCRKLPND
ncbi:hypothetical protein QYM36_008969 [Artemia franciscana]|uniref:Methyltransferase FkbM domain-containing protein n=1 Tax=Artemia franciscana TaxID=6661 RepID=A0AA88I3D8_ARTSF|nr:hypothetical protein QYM36_008969 [Artemia franciscana]